MTENIRRRCFFPSSRNKTDRCSRRLASSAFLLLSFTITSWCIFSLWIASDESRMSSAAHPWMYMLYTLVVLALGDALAITAHSALTWLRYTRTLRVCWVKS